MRTTTALSDGRIYVTLYNGAVDLRCLASPTQDHIQRILEAYSTAEHGAHFQSSPHVQHAALAAKDDPDLMTILEDLALRLHLEDVLGERFQIVDLPIWRVEEMRAYVESALAA